MAVCIPADGYQDVGADFGCGDGSDPSALNEGGIDMQGQIGPWCGEAMQMPYWQDLNEQLEYGGLGQNEWPPVPNGGWMGNGGNSNMEWRSGRSGNGMGHSRQKRRFCTSYPDVGLCRRGATCAFAHSREEINAPLLEIEEEKQEPSALTDEFFMYKYKTRWCPVGVQHEWHTCVYAHNYQDARRPVSIGYGARLCPYWSKKDTGAEYSQRCPLGLRCPYSHGAKEQLYHPHYFKTVVCRDLKGKACPRQLLCAFFHHRAERRVSPADDVDYSQPLLNEALPGDWIADFLSPPFLPESSKGPSGGCGGEDTTWQDMSPMKGDNSQVVPYNPHQMGPGPHGQFGQQMPCVIFLPMNGMNGMPMSPQNGPGGDMSPAGMQLPPNWVFVPMDGSAPIPC
eukprot:CAMPEP_0195060358 /NCGR_PEP_ID=MMETSP0448-20130528/7633_1 /TAXON_ID=66468 /ORGANISM="Heterocapsa triquestra, Strain CCMP 448" /LENGTH=395 /DNA_ID=CAMNT_0040090757 /DNA_START=102 /DNA_END=1289 /DNA_ORIENTATION=-